MGFRREPASVALLPLAALGLLVIWTLPEVRWAPTRTLRWAFYASFIGLICWPNYLAISLPGLPWITVIRLTTPATLTLLRIGASPIRTVPGTVAAQSWISSARRCSSDWAMRRRNRRKGSRTLIRDIEEGGAGGRKFPERSG